MNQNAFGPDPTNVGFKNNAIRALDGVGCCGAVVSGGPGCSMSDV